MSQGGYYFALSGGRFVFCGDIGLGGSAGDGTLCVTGATADVTTVSSMVNAALQDGLIAMPMPLTGRWQISYAALLAAQASGVRAVVTPTTA